MLTIWMLQRLILCCSAEPDVPPIVTLPAIPSSSDLDQAEDLAVVDLGSTRYVLPILNVPCKLTNF